MKESRLPTYPFEVVFQSTELMNPSLRFDSIDVLVNRNSLRKFFNLCMGRTQDSFRVNLYLVNSTLVIERCVKSPTKEFLNGSSGSGYGHGFERATTQMPPELLDSSAHHRMLRYELGGLECAVHFEVDASYDDPNAAGLLGVGERSEAAHGGAVESLEAAVSSMKLGESAITGANDVSVSAISRGSGTPQASVAELKSRTRAKNGLRALPQLWFGRTRYLITGLHQNGTFAEVKVEDLKEDLVAWENEERNQDGLRKMVILLSQLRDAVSMVEGKACVAIHEKGVKNGVLRVFASTSGKGPLPDSVIKRFWKA